MVPVNKTCPPPRVLRENRRSFKYALGGGMFSGGGLEKRDDDMGSLEVWSPGCYLLIANILEYGNISLLR